jgi:hypothetical protein
MVKSNKEGVDKVWYSKKYENLSWYLKIKLRNGEVQQGEG